MRRRRPRRFRSDLSLDDVARRIATSRRQLQRIYAEVGRTTFRDQLTSVRMDRAADMLAEDGMTVREIANRVGYRQPAQFAKAFRLHHGQAPSEYRHARGTTGAPTHRSRPRPRRAPARR
jgi:AraC-like DNA-binding protein